MSTQYETSLQDLSTIVTVANAAMYNFRVELPIYTDEQDREVAKADEFLACLKTLGLKKLFEPSRFSQLQQTLKAHGIMKADQTLDVKKLFSYMRQMDYDHAGKLLAPTYHEMQPKAHRVLNRFSRLMSLYASQQGKSVSVA